MSNENGLNVLNLSMNYQTRVVTIIPYFQYLSGSFDKYRQNLDSFGIISPDKCRIVPEKSLSFPGKIESYTGKIENTPGLIVNNAGLINDSTGLIPKTKTEYTASGRRKRSRERGKDRRPRISPLPTIKNLPQFRNKPHKEIRQYILEKKRVDIGSNF